VRLKRKLLDRLPPTLALALSEGVDATRANRALDRGFIRELREQAVWSAVNWKWADAPGTKADGAYLIAPSEGLNPLSPLLKCAGPACRFGFTEDFGRFVALYTDGAIVGEPLTDVLLQENDRIIEFALKDLMVLLLLLPLVEEDLLRFAAPVRGVCGDCSRELRLAPRRMAKEVLAAGRDKFRLERHDHKGQPHLSVINPFLLETTAETLEYCFRLTPTQVRRLNDISPAKAGRPLPREALTIVEPLLLQRLEPAMHTLLWQSSVAGRTGAQVVSNCRAENLAFSSRYPRPSARAVVAAETVRKVRLPWMENVSVSEALQIRHTASASLSSLRQRLASAKEDATPSVVEELRADADEVERSLRPRRGRMLQDVALLPAMLGIVFSGMVHETTTAIAAALFAGALQLRNQADAEHRASTALKARPGYALLEAKRLLAKRGGAHRRPWLPAHR
jgi:hypothetical protein